MGLRQSDLSRKLGIPQATLSGYEHGHREVGAEWLSKIAGFFDVSVDYLVGATEFKKGIRYMEDVFLDNGGINIRNRDFFDRVGKLSPEGKSVINNMVEVLLK
jgi:transcriptional regulator with XRE-family HTH domain